MLCVKNLLTGEDELTCSNLTINHWAGCAYPNFTDKESESEKLSIS